MDSWAVAFIVSAVLCVFALAWAMYLNHVRNAQKADAQGLKDSEKILIDDIPVRPTARRFVESIPGAVIVCRGSGSVIYTSQTARSRNLVDKDRMGSRELRDILSQVVADGQTREREVEIDIPHRSTPGGTVAGRGVQAGGTVPSNTMHLQVRASAIADDLYAIFVTDISERRQFEAMRRDFMTNVSHELKTPAGAIALLAETINDASDDPKAVKYFSARISLESKRLTELVQRLIDLQRAQKTPALHNAERLSTLSVVGEAVKANAVLADNKHIDIHVTLGGRTVARTSNGDVDFTAPTDVFVSADREAMTTAVKNLVQNAIRYSPEQTTVGVGIIQQGDKVMIRVVDQGIGIPPQSLGRIFERFYRVDPARSRETGGSGLGLSITKHCVEECGGTISVWSRQGEGSTFTIELPVAPTTVDGSQEPDPTEDEIAVATLRHPADGTPPRHPARSEA